LLDHREFVEWHKQTSRTPRFRRYGDRRPFSRRNRPREDSKPLRASSPLLGVENQFIGKALLGKKSFTIWDNVTEPIDNLYRQQGIPKSADIP
jgi:hypothetical protein